MCVFCSGGLAESNGGFLSSFFVCSGWDIDRFFFIQSIPLKSITLWNVEYPTLKEYTMGLQPQQSMLSTCNAKEDGATTEKVSYSKAFGTHLCWNVPETTWFGVKPMVQAEVPIVVDDGDGYTKRWSTSEPSPHNICVDTFYYDSASVDVVVSPRERKDVYFTQYASSIPKLDFTAQLTFDFARYGLESITETIPIANTFDGVFISPVQQTFVDHNLAEGQSCS